ncbi:hypothetical protein ABZ905_27380 [Streptomyces parvus]|uniref:hypothetical protein n=1 Tax=Streptomyces TaxID=1883 RepID=UPI0029A410F0|nr:hypothetical protein [Streptomyces sp. ME02-6979.5a]MDX3342611.1 hypothetical protein [Streptomyces sp. ME02-6979.5a]
MDTPVAWELVAKPWSEELHEKDGFGAYWKQFRLNRGYSLDASPDPLTDGFLDCLSWYFGECVYFSGTLDKPSGTDTAAYRSSVKQLFHDWYPMFCEDYARAISRADEERTVR